MALIAADMMVACTGSSTADYSFGAALGTGVLQSVRFLLLVRPLEEYRHESDKVPAHQLSFMQRLIWVMKLIYSPRGIGWSFKAENSVVPVDPRHRTRASFIASRLRWLLSYYLFWDAATLYMRCNPALFSGASFTSQGYIMQCLNVAVAFCQYYAILACIHCAAAVLAVVVNLNEPQAWPQLFGHWKDAYTIRKFWGKVWHQMLRHHLTLFGPHRPKRNPWDPVSTEYSSAREREPWATSYRRLCYAFVCSAFVHVCGDVVLQLGIWKNISSTGASKAMDVPNVIGRSAPYFLLQPVGVLVEDAVMEVGKRMGLKEGTWTRMVGYVWVAAFMGLFCAASLDALSIPFRVGHQPGEGAEDRTTLIEAMANRAFGVQLVPLLSPWFPAVTGS
ncbi:membrane bound O-acyl transferase family-domain-containing protein [Pisolithus croceorrhizus]|nr:membrane bound O-acyl transferase family-domain-containing protein [Pisolithus croceorrhizus]KAI6120487.1 membrane bound O-acyl transferase family-domain-containing protein [Pisolithus croceorrhizus]KAI6164410.1 membrane bound O-acyl transferase family-domain-containing protein [Pisolithus thermaeus]